LDHTVLNMKLMNGMNIMNRPSLMVLSSLLMGLLFSSNLVAQPDGRPGGVDREALRERMEVMAVGFLTEELDLDAESAQVFWPIYNAHKEELDLASRELKAIQQDLNNFEGGSDDEFDGLLDRLEAAEFGLPQLRAQFLRDVSAEFGPDFAVRCIAAQKKFKEVVRKRMQQRMSGQNGRRLGGRPRRP
jgi:hypothetical protein